MPGHALKGNYLNARLKGSFARRITLLVMAFLLLPMGILSAALYLHELKGSKKANMYILNLVSDAVEGEIRLYIEGQKKLLSVLLEEVPDAREKGKLCSIVAAVAGARAVYVMENGRLVTSSEKYASGNLPEGFFLIEERAVKGSSVAYMVMDTAYIDSVFSKYEKKHPSVKIESIPNGQGVPQFSAFAAKEGALLPMSGYILKMLIIFFIFLIFGTGCIVFLTKRMARPLKRLCKTMLSLQQGNREARYEEDLLGFEINVVGGIFNETVASIDSHIQALEKERNEKQLLADELLLGQALQKSLLTSSLPKNEEVELYGGFLSAKEVGGDFYDGMLRSREGKSELLLVIADAAGKGISACLHSLSVRSMLRSFFEAGQTIEEIIRHTNTLFCKDAAASSTFITLWVGIYCPSSQKLEYANCGHHPAHLKRSEGELELLHSRNMALGVMEFESVEKNETTLLKGDMLLLFTDGVIEAHTKEFALYGEQRIATILERNTQGPRDLVEHIMDDIEQFSEGTAQFDDITLLALHVTAK